MHHEYTPEDAEKFWSHVDKSGGIDACWPWMRSRNAKGYGHHCHDGIVWQAHRFAALISGIDISACVCHACDSPPCCNPLHLWSGTNKENVDDKVRKGRAKGMKGAQHPRAKVTDDDVLEIRRLCREGALFQYEIAALYGMRQGSVNNIYLRRSWKHIE